MYEFWYDYVKQKYREETELCYMDTGSFTVYIKTNDIYKYIAEELKDHEKTSFSWKEDHEKAYNYLVDDSNDDIKK